MLRDLIEAYRLPVLELFAEDRGQQLRLECHLADRAAITHRRHCFNRAAAEHDANRLRFILPERQPVAKAFTPRQLQGSVHFVSRDDSYERAVARLPSRRVAYDFRQPGNPITRQLHHYTWCTVPCRRSLGILAVEEYRWSSPEYRRAVSLRVFDRQSENQSARRPLPRPRSSKRESMAAGM